MTDDALPIAEALELVATGDFCVTGLPTLRGRGLYLVHHRRGDDDGRFTWFSLDNRGRSASRYRAMTRAQAHAFLARYAGGETYPRELLARWDEQREGPSPALVRAALLRTEALLQRLQGDPSACARVMTSWWLRRSPWMGWIASLVPGERAPSAFAADDTRAGSELLSMALADPEHDVEEPPAHVAAHLQDVRRRADEVFGAHGPTRARVMWTQRREGSRAGFAVNARGQYVELGLEGGEEEAPRLVYVRKTPTEHAHEQLFQAFDRARLSGSMALDDALVDTVTRAGDPAAIEGWLARREIVVRCGEFRVDSWVSDTETTLLDTYKGQRKPIREALAPFLGDEGFCEVRFERFIPLSQRARAEDDPTSSKVRYTVPKGWAYRFSRERQFERALAAILRAATGYAGPLERVETQDPVDRERRREPSRRVALKGDAVGVTLVLDPIESGHGVHGEHVSARFHGLPEGLGVRARGRLDMRAGGQLHVDFEGAPELALRLKRACLEALP
ncbi:MAG: hypothetical protein H6713_22095 [Myxococcales bacterium]|nr:hypothetical protein [Myxococcales bacterium]